ncbi:MAG TPA: hypothetical protein VGL81_11455 [Polyangiaceae bacterium]
MPIEKIVHRYARSMGHLDAAIRLADRVYVYDNSIDGIDASLCVRTQEGISDAVRPLGRHAQFVDVRAA